MFVYILFWQAQLSQICVICKTNICLKCSNYLNFQSLIKHPTISVYPFNVTTQNLNLFRTNENIKKIWFSGEPKFSLGSPKKLFLLTFPYEVFNIYFSFINF